MQERYAGTEGKHIKEGDEVEATFFSYVEPLSSVTGTVEGEYLNVTKGSIPLSVLERCCAEIRIIEETEHDKGRIKGALLKTN